MPDPDIFISSCSRRQAARRRASRGPMRGVVRVQLPVALLQLLVALLLIAAAFGAFVAGRGGLV
jgi:hypothetical protein